jgi:hypothetical protein
MMPPFPWSPLKFRKAGFPRYGFKAGLSDGACPGDGRPRPGLPPSFVSTACRPRTLRSAPERAARMNTAMRAAPPPYPRGPRSGPGCIVPVHHHLLGPIRLARGRIATSPARLIRDAFAVPRPRRPASDSGLSLHIPFLDMSSSRTPESPSAAHAQFLRRRRGPSSILQRLGTLDYPTIIRFEWDPQFRGYRFAFATTCRFACLPWRTRPGLHPADEDVPSGLSTGRSPFPPPDVATVATGQVPPAGPSHAGIAASLAAGRICGYC